MTEPPVLILDEPTSGLDPLMIEAFSETVDELARAGRTTVFLSSHILSEVDRICQRIGLVRGGQLVAVRTLSELRAAAPRRMTVMFSTPVNGDMPVLPGATLVTREPARWVLDVQGPLGDIIPRLGTSAGRRRAARARSRWTKRFFVSWGTSKRTGTSQRTCPTKQAHRDGARAAIARAREDPVGIAGRWCLPALQLSIIAAAAIVRRRRQLRTSRASRSGVCRADDGTGTDVIPRHGAVRLLRSADRHAVWCSSRSISPPNRPARSNRISSICVLARPLPRHVIVSRSFLVMAIGTLLMSGAMQATTWAGLWWMAPADAQWPAARTVLSLSAHMTLIAWCFGVRRAGRVRLGAAARRRRRRRSASSRSPPTWSSSSSRSGRRRASSPASRRSTTTRATGILAGTAPEASNLAVLGTDGAGCTGPRLLEVSTARPVGRGPARAEASPFYAG